MRPGESSLYRTILCKMEAEGESRPGLSVRWRSHGQMLSGQWMDFELWECGRLLDVGEDFSSSGEALVVATSGCVSLVIHAGPSITTIPRLHHHHPVPARDRPPRNAQIKYKFVDWVDEECDQLEPSKLEHTCSAQGRGAAVERQTLEEEAKCIVDLRSSQQGTAY